ncbi:MAG: hypothetical protein LAT84_02325 [Balneolia bacterium]|nr:hypothetical protein [Balneolia bacterium]
MRSIFQSLLVLLILFAIPSLTACSGVHDEEPVTEIRITLDAQNQLYVDGQKSHLTRLQNLVETHPQHEQVSYILETSAESCIYRINDITRTIHPAPLQFASAE